MSEPLPELCQGVMDSRMLNSFVRDLMELAEILNVIVKGGSQSHASATGLTLSEAVELLRRGELRGVQVHYTWDEEAWLDTLIGDGHQIRLVRRSC